MDTLEDRAQFLEIAQGTQDDWTIIMRHADVLIQGLPDRVLAHLMLLKGDSGGFRVDRLEHSLQTATRAYRDGRDERYVVMALLHDIGDTLATYNHTEIGAAMIRPFVSEDIHWIAQQHAIFQGYYFFHFIGRDRDQREQYRGHPSFAACAEFCELYDQKSFDPNYDSASIEFFRPMVQRVLSKPLDRR